MEIMLKENELKIIGMFFVKRRRNIINGININFVLEKKEVNN